VSFTEMFESSASSSMRRQHVVVLTRDRTSLVGRGDVLAQHVDRRELSFRVQLANDADCIVERRPRDVTRRQP